MSYELEHNQVQRLAALFEHAPVAVVTGAGVSTDSGIPDYRGIGSLPRNPMRINDFLESVAYRQRFWAGASVNALSWATHAPNAGHRALAALEARCLINGVITQNVDGLHMAAGSQRVVELHGTGTTVRCISCGARTSRAEMIARFNHHNPGYVASQQEAALAPDGDAAVTGTDHLAVPACLRCGGIVRPEVVYFGETVAPEVFADAAQLVQEASALLVVGSSLAVNTAVRLVQRAAAAGKPVAIINRGATSQDAKAQFRIDHGTSETLTALITHLGISPLGISPFGPVSASPVTIVAEEAP